MAAAKYNLNNAGVKRILQEVKEMQNNPSDDFLSRPLEDNIFEWQFAIRGPQDSEFEGGIYHGRIQLPAEYPFKPPSFMLLTPNGRFETQTKICLSISQYHPEHWQPSWSVRTALVALIAFMPTKGNGAIGSLEFTAEERKALALKSVKAPPKYGNAERQKLIDEIHEEMLKRVRKNSAHASKEDNGEAVHTDMCAVSSNQDIIESAPAPTSSEPQSNECIDPAIMANTGASRDTQTSPAAAAMPLVRPQSSDDQFLTMLAIGLVVALLALLYRKFSLSLPWISYK